MNIIAALHRQRLDTAALTAAARACCSVPLRRAGPMTELVITGVHACLDGQPELPSAVIWGSRTGTPGATARVVSDLCIAGEAPLPFDFLATQPALAAVPVQQTFPCVANALYQPWQNHADRHWAYMLHLALAWLRAGRHTRVLCGQIEPRRDGGSGDWLMLTTAEAEGPAPEHRPAGSAATLAGSAAALFDWLAAGSTGCFTLAAADTLPALRFTRATTSEHCRLA